MAGVLRQLAAIPGRLEAVAGDRDSIAAVEADVEYAAQLLAVCVRPPERVSAALQKARTALNTTKYMLS